MTPVFNKSPCDVHRHSENYNNSASSHDPVPVMHLPLPRVSEIHICVDYICGHVVLCDFYCASYISMGAKVQKVGRFNTVCISVLMGVTVKLEVHGTLRFPKSIDHNIYRGLSVRLVAVCITVTDKYYADWSISKRFDSGSSDFEFSDGVLTLI